MNPLGPEEGVCCFCGLAVRWKHGGVWWGYCTDYYGHRGTGWICPENETMIPQPFVDQPNKPWNGYDPDDVTRLDNHTLLVRAHIIDPLQALLTSLPEGSRGRRDGSEA